MTDNRAATSEVTTSQFLTQLLSIQSPELGARLKQRLNAAFIASGLGFFDEKSLGFGKFTDYLLRVHGDLVNVEREEGVGDILVSLRADPTKRTQLSAPHSRSKLEDPQVIRSDVWQAFANPDLERKRFLNKETGKVVHFLSGKHCAERQEVESSADFLEILPIPTESQIKWMKEFLAGISLPSNEKQVLEGLIGKPYSSAVNVTFTRALGSNGLAWRNFRTERVTYFIHQWVAEKGVSLDKIHVATTEPAAAISVEAAPTDGALGSSQSLQNTKPVSEPLSPREQVAKLLELLTDDDITRLVIPTLLSTILIKSRM